MYFQIAYLKHLLTASNQHGVHSPFVYDFITKCLYKKANFNGTKSEKVALKSFPYFSVERFKISSKDSRLENRILKEFDLKASEEGALDLLFIDVPQADVLSIHQELIQNDTIILIDNIHKNKEASRRWDVLRQHEKATVSIDLFYCGLLSFRKEQVKEHFKIRI